MLMIKKIKKKTPTPSIKQHFALRFTATTHHSNIVGAFSSSLSEQSH